MDSALDELRLSNLPQDDIPITQGDIMTIRASGLRSVSRFDDSQLWPRQYFYNWGLWGQKAETTRKPDDYMDTVLEYGQRHGVSGSFGC